MKKITVTLSLIAAVIINCQCLAQAKFHLGLTTAVNSTFVLDKGLAEDPRYDSQLRYRWAPIGAAAGVDFSRGWGLQLESILSRQGQIYQIIDVAQQPVGERRIDLEYIQLPLLLRMFGSGNSRTRFNFMFGPQLSILTYAREAYNQYQTATLVLPEGIDQPPAGATNYNPQTRTYTMPATAGEVAISAGKRAVDDFRKQNLELAMGLGINVSITNNLYISTNLRGTYGFTDIRNEDVIASVKNNTGNQFVKDLFGHRANATLGLQLGLHYTFGQGVNPGNRPIRSIGPMD
jgi:hypothetical protein